jgi:multimeric flavodoxin WrbA
MNKKVLVLSSSPRKGGNSDVLCDQFISGAQEAGHQAEKIFLKDKKINYCTGCGTCFNGGKPCPQKDDMTEILEKMVEADVIVMATPIYFYTMCGQMKTLIDRTCSRYTEITNKEFYFIVTAAVNSKPAMQRTLEEFRGFTSCLSGPKEKGVVYGIGTCDKGEIKGKPAMKEAFQLGISV